MRSKGQSILKASQDTLQHILLIQGHWVVAIQSLHNASASKINEEDLIPALLERHHQQKAFA